MEISGDGYQYHQIRRREEKEKEEHTEDEEEEEEEETRTMCCMQKKPYLTIVTLIAIAISLILCFDYSLRDHLKNGMCANCGMSYLLTINLHERFITSQLIMVYCRLLIIL